MVLQIGLPIEPMLHGSSGPTVSGLPISRTPSVTTSTLPSRIRAMPMATQRICFLKVFSATPEGSLKYVAL